MITKQEFKQKFETEFAKEKRIFKRAQTFAWTWVIAMTILVIGATIGAHFLFDPNGSHVFLYIIICVFAWFAIATLPLLSVKEKLVAGFKKFDLRKILEIIYGSNVEYLKQNFVDKNLLIKSGFCDSLIDTYGGEDYFSTTIERQTPFGNFSTQLVASDVRAEKIITDEDGNKKRKKIFSGVFGAIKFRMPFNCKLYLNANKNITLQQLETESPEFNKLFNTKTDNQVQARLILSVTMMQKLIDFTTKAKCKIGFSFVDDHLYFYLNKNLFEPSIKVDKFSFSLIEPIYDDLELLDSLITEIISNRKIFRV